MCNRLSTIKCTLLKPVYCTQCFFPCSTMPELHINGRSTYHNFFFEMSYVETSNATSPTLLVTERSRNSTTILSNTTNTVSSENSYCGIVFVITCFCFAVVLMIAIGIWHVRKRQIMKTREGQESIESIETDSLFPPNFMRNCNWTKIYTNDYYHNVIQSDLRGYMTRWTAMFEKEYCFGFFVFQADIYQE